MHVYCILFMSIPCPLDEFVIFSDHFGRCHCPFNLGRVLGPVCMGPVKFHIITDTEVNYHQACCTQKRTPAGVAIATYSVPDLYCAGMLIPVFELNKSSSAS